MIRQDAIDFFSSKAYRFIETYSDPCQTPRMEYFEKIFTLPISKETQIYMFDRTLNMHWVLYIPLL